VPTPSAISLCFIGHRLPTDVVDAALERHAVELVDPKRDKKPNPRVKLMGGISESSFVLVSRAHHGSRVGARPNAR